MDKLAALPDEALFKLKARIDDACLVRKKKLLIPGKEATFVSNRDGSNIRIKITKCGLKNVIGYQIHADGRHDMRSRWRVSPDLLMPYFPKHKAPPPPPTGSGKDLPASVPAQSF